MKVALVHDYLSEFGGAERVLKALTEIYPKAPIYTAFTIKNSTAWEEFKDKEIIESKYARVLKQKKLYSPLRFLAPKIWQSFDFSKYDVIISSASWYITKGFNLNKINNQSTTNQQSIDNHPIVICYCHTPPRYLYGYQTSIEWQRYWPIKLYAIFVNKSLRQFDFQASQQVDYFITNSKNTLKRIEKFYRRKANVIYPPVRVEEIKEATAGLKPKDYFLIVSRVVGAKGIELAMKAAKKGQLKLKIIGETAGLKWKEEEFKKLKSKNVEFLGRVSDKDLWKLYGECRAFLALAQDEDFGITVVEAMAAGRPVIAFRGGGYKETVVEGKTGIFIDDYCVNNLVVKLKNLKVKKFKREDCIKQAEKFAEDNFKTEIKNFVKAKYKLIK